MGVADILSKKVKGVSDKVKGMKAMYEQPSGDSAAIAEKMKGIDEYKRSVPPEPVKPVVPDAPVKPNPKTQYGTRPGEKRLDTTQMTRPLGSFHKGGKVKKDGAYNLKKGEAVLTKGQQKKQATSVLGGVQNPAVGSPPDDMHISKLDDKSFQITHNYNSKGVEPSKPSKKFSAKNAKHLVRHVRAAFSAPAESPEQPDGDEA